jgi:hypothetical protein
MRTILDNIQYMKIRWPINFECKSAIIISTQRSILGHPFEGYTLVALFHISRETSEKGTAEYS